MTDPIVYEPLSGRQFPRFSGVKTFFRLPHVAVDADYDVGIVGVPFDGGTSYRPGARFAPSAVRETSSLGRVFHWPRAATFTRLKVADVGDCPTVPIDLAQTYARIEAFYGAALAHGKRLLSVGGDHSTTLPILRALRAHHGRPLNFIHFDAHLDTYPPAWDCDYHHGSFARHAVEEGLVDPAHMAQIGLRGPLTGAADLEFVQRHGIHVVTVDHVRLKGLPAVLAGLPAFDEGPTYISYDIDCLDPAYAPGTGTPVPGGLTTWEAQQLFRGLKIGRLAGADVVEVSPPYDHAQITALAAMDALFELLHLF